MQVVKFLFPFVAVASCCAALADEPAFALHSGDRVVFYGDSITEQQMYTTIVEDFVATRYPGLNVKFFARGWGGDRVTGGGGGPAETRVERDVLPLHPTVLTIMLGMNDGSYRPFDREEYSTFDDGYRKLIKLFEAGAPDAKLTLIRTSPYDQFTVDLQPFDANKGGPWNGYNDALLQNAHVVEYLATAHRAALVDFNEPLVKVLTAAKAQDPDLAPKLIPDRVHPTPAAHLVMAAQLLKSWNPSPSVCSVKLDASNKRVVTVSNARVSGFDGMSWKERDGALPFAMDPDNKLQQLVLKVFPFQDEMNREMLSVDGLKEGNYTLTIDGMNAGSFSAGQLHDGVNLAGLDTPMTRQSLDVMSLVRNRSRVDFVNWREMMVPHPRLGYSRRVWDSAMSLNDAIDREIHQAAQPTEHVFRLTVG